MSEKIKGKPYVLDIMEEIAKERIRLDGLVRSPEYPKNKKYWGWMEKWLAKTDEEHYRKGWLGGTCNICGRKARFFLRMDFSFCEEYGCGIQICSKCLRKMQRIFKDEVRKRQQEGRHEIHSDTKKQL